MSLFGDRYTRDMPENDRFQTRKLPPDHNQNFQFLLKRPKVYSTREFPLHCGPSSSKNGEGIGAGSSLKSTELSYASNHAITTPSKLPRSVNNETVRPLGSQNRVLHHVNEVVSPEIKWRREKRRSENHDLVGASSSGNSNMIHCKEKLSIVSPDTINEAAKVKVKDARKLFEKLYNEISDEYKGKRKAEYNGGPKICMEAAQRLRKTGKWVCLEKQMGHVEGITVGDRFHFRAELAVVGLHWPYFTGIDYLSLNGKIFAISIVDSGHYENSAKSVDVLIYSGEGGNPMLGNCKNDQELKRGNLALKNSMDLGYPVRVISKSKESNSFHMNRKGVLMSTYEYKGLYMVKSFWQEKDHDHRLVFKFELHRIQGQAIVSSRVGREFIKSERCLVEDVSQGKEKMPIRVINAIDDAKPLPFTYITETIYPNWWMNIEHSGCTCTNGCSDMEQCHCVLKNGGEIVYECGPFCKCPPSCINRVTQQGPKYKLEIYKTKFERWGVRSRSYISSGSFVCECVGMLAPSKEDLQRGLEEGEVGFSFIVDMVKFGNVGRFIGHSDSPNLDARYILYDHDDKGMAHIMLFAAKSIPPTKELTCDHNLMRVIFANGINN